jgi:hypothetical protein
VVKSPGCKLARNALALLDQSVEVYGEGSKLCRPAATVVRTGPLAWGVSPALMQTHMQPMLEKLRGRAHHTYTAYCANINGGPQTLVPHGLQDDIHDLSAFGGTKGAVINKSPSVSPQGSGASSPDSNPPGDIPPNSAHTQRSSHSPSSLSHHSAVTFSSCGSYSPHRPDAHTTAENPYGSILSAGSIPEAVQQPQFGLPYPTTLNNTPAQGVPDFGSPPFVSQAQAQSLLPSPEGGYSVIAEDAQSPPSQDATHEQNPAVPLWTVGDILDFDLDALDLPPIAQQPMQYSEYPQLQQFRDVFIDNGADPRPPQIPQDDTWWKFLDGLGIQRDSLV